MSTAVSARDARAFEFVSAARVRELLADRREIAFLDVREEGVFDRGHPFLAVSIPFSHLEQRLDALVPRRETRIVLLDERGEGLAERAAQRMAGWGYTDISILLEGLEGWRAAGFEVFAGIYVPNKAFGEFVEHWYETPSINAVQLRKWIDAGKDMIILDSRPYEEFSRYSLPGGINCPGAELVHRAFGLVKDERTTIVVNCAGRTRGIIGAQSLINAGMPNPVVWLKDGTAGWYLSGEAMAYGSSCVAPPPTLRALQRAIDASHLVAARLGVREIDGDEYLELARQADARTLYLFDVRTPAEYRAGHLRGARSAPGGQLIQSTEHYVGTRGARIVLCDDNGVRARMTASWLVQLGWVEVFVLSEGLGALGPSLESGPEPVGILGTDASSAVPQITVLELTRMLQADEAVVVDVASSLHYRARHIPHSWFAVRSRFMEGLRKLPARQRLVLTSEDGEFARIAAADAAAATSMEVAVLKGGTDAWMKAGLPLNKGLENVTGDTDDVWYSPYDQEDLRGAMSAYLRWEVDLVRQVEREEYIPFKRIAWAKPRMASGCGGS